MDFEKSTIDIHEPVVVTTEKLIKWRNDFYNQPKNILSQNVAVRHNPFEICLQQELKETPDSIFHYKIDCERKSDIKAKKNPNESWLSSALALVRLPFIKQHNLSEFEFSVSYLYYWDRIEKCNFFLNNIVNLARKGEPIDGRLTSYVLKHAMRNEGQWHMFVNLITKYGIMPMNNFLDTYSFETTKHLNVILSSKLREYAKDLNVLIESEPDNMDAVNTKIDLMLAEIYKVIGICLGIPAEYFIWEYYNKSKSYKKVGPITPLSFYEQYVSPYVKLENKFCFINDPRPTSSYNQLYTFECLGNVVGGLPILLNNQPIENLLKMTTESIIAGETVWFGCESSTITTQKNYIDDVNMYNFKLLFDFDVKTTLSKADRLMYRDARMTNAKLLVAFSNDENRQPIKFGLDKSSGIIKTLHADWFKEFGYQVVVDKKFVPKELMTVFEGIAEIWPPWDPFSCVK